jgi:hypothetical protein
MPLGKETQLYGQGIHTIVDTFLTGDNNDERRRSYQASEISDRSSTGSAANRHTAAAQQLSSSAAQQQLHPKFPRIPSLPEHPRCDHDDDDGDSGGIAKNNSIDENIFQIKQSLIGVDDLFRRYFDSSIPISVSTIGI